MTNVHARIASCLVSLSLVCVLMLLPPAAGAHETDNVTCRARLLIDAQPELDGWVNARIARAIARANGAMRCDAACLQREIRREVGGSSITMTSWDEGLNPSRFHPALRVRIARDPPPCGDLTLLPEAHLYVNPVCWQ